MVEPLFVITGPSFSLELSSQKSLKSDHYLNHTFGTLLVFPGSSFLYIVDPTVNVGKLTVSVSMFLHPERDRVCVPSCCSCSVFALLTFNPILFKTRSSSV